MNHITRCLMCNKATHQTSCARCHTRTRRLIDWILTDYAILRTQFPKPHRPEGRAAPRQSRTYGHPAEWASDTSRQIADQLDQLNNDLRAHLAWTPPPARQRAESRVVMHAYNTLTTATKQLMEWQGTPAAITALNDTHNTIRRYLGLNRQRQHLPAPCPNCQHLGLVREVHLDRRDAIQCLYCQTEIKELEYGLFARIIIDELLQKADQEAESTDPI